MNTRFHSAELISIAVVFLVLLFSTSTVFAATGLLVGKVTDEETGEPLAWVNIVFGDGYGGFTFEDGTFKIKGPPGKYTVKAMMMGYKPQEKKGVVIKAGQTTKINFSLKTTIVDKTEEIIVEAGRKQIDVKSSDVRHAVSDDELQDLPVDNIDEALALKTGIIKTGDELHVRGGRGGEVSYLIDGVPVNDPLGGGKISVGLMGSSESEIITGGMSAEYGNAQSAVVNVSTREGGRTYEGQFRYMTDDFGRKDKTYTNYDRFSIGFGGPTPIEDLTFYLSGELAFSDGEYWAGIKREKHTFLNDLFSFTDRAYHNYNIQGKLAYKIKPNLKLTGEAIYTKSRTNAFGSGYANNWDIQGYVQKVYRFMTLKAYAGDLFDDPPPDARDFNWVVSVYKGPWMERELERKAEYVDDRDLQKKYLYPVRVFTKVTTGGIENPEVNILSYENFYARRVHDVYGNEVEIIWDEAVVNEDGETESYEEKVLFEGFRNPDSKFSHFRDDSSYVEFNSAERLGTNENESLNLKLALNHNISDNIFYTVRASRSHFFSYSSVNGKNPEEFETGGLGVVLPTGSFNARGESNTVWYTDPDNPYYVTAYDAPYYMDRNTDVYTLKADITSKKWGGHTAKAGLQFLYNDLDEFTLYYPGSLRWLEEEGRYMQGQSSNDFHNFNPEGSFYIQDKWDYKGMVVNAGIRLDLFSPGNSTEIEIVSSGLDYTVDKLKYQVSPRLGFAFPITDKDKFHFHYGRFTQWPSRSYLFHSQDMVSGSGTLGNPNLDEQLTVSYQAGVSHQFSQTVAGELVVFNKDIYGLVSSTRVTDEDLGATGYRHINRAYASSRGVEVNFSKRLSHHFAGEISYTFSFAEGVASDANFGVTAEGLSHLPTQEMPLDWDQRHTLNIRLTLNDENKWGSTFIYSFGSGLPWTPYDRWARKQDPLLENSERHEATHNVSVQGRKMFDIYGQELTFYFEGRNLLDQDILQNIAPGVFPGMPNAVMDNGSYFTEAGRTGGAYLQDINDDGIEDFNPVHDPTVWASRRQWRIGFGFEF